MLSRALSLATVTLLIGCLTAGAARAVENLDAGKSPSQIFSNTCSACHKSPRGLLKNTPASSLPGFLRQHYTTGTDMAAVLSSYLISNGASDPRYQGKEQPKTEQVSPAAKDDDATRDATRSETGAVDSTKPGSAEPAPDTVKADPSGSDAAIVKVDPPQENATIKVDAPKENTGGEVNPLRPDPVPSAAPAPPASAAIAPDPSASTSTPPASSQPVTATVPGPPAGPPVPPISR